MGWGLAFIIKTTNMKGGKKVIYEFSKGQIEKIEGRFKSFSSEEEGDLNLNGFKNLKELAKGLSKDFKVNVKMDQTKVKPINIKIGNPINGIRQGINLMKEKVINEHDQSDQAEKNLSIELMKESKKVGENLDERIDLWEVLDEYKD
jgi:hypothetical protein